MSFFDDHEDSIVYGRYFDRRGLGDDDLEEPRELKCRRCGSTHVRWAQQKNGKWVMVNLETRAVHRCEPDLSGFTVEPEA